MPGPVLTAAVKAAASPRTRRPLLWIAAAAGAVVVLLAAAFTAVVAFMFNGGTTSAAYAASYCISPASPRQALGAWSAEQMTNAATIVTTGQAMHVPAYGQLIAVATAMQESWLVNLDYGDRDSLGLFQQRPSQGWGTPAQIMDPVYASSAFYSHLLAVPGWQRMPLTEAAQAVQNSAAPGAYAQWQQPAARLIGHLQQDGALQQDSATAAGGGCAEGQVPTGSAAAVLAWAQAQLGTMYSFGGDCTAPHSADMARHCDCSSLVQQAFAHRAGLRMPRTAEAQWEWGLAGHALVIPPAQAQPGDVVYYPTYLGPNVQGHTGIVVNGPRHIMIDAYDTGLPVRYDSYAGAMSGHLFTILRFVNTG